MNDRKLDRLFDLYRRKGDTTALARIFDAAAPELLGLAVHLVRDVGEGEDLVQQTFLTAIEKAQRYDAKRRLIPWLVGIMVRHAHELRRKRARVEQLPLPERTAPDGPVESAADGEFTEALERALESLPQHVSAVLEPYLLRGERAVDIARASGKSAGTVRVQIRRGLDELRRALPPGLALGAAALVGGRSLADVRVHVLERASRVAPAPSASPLLSLGLSSKLFAVVLLALASAALWWSGQRTLEPHMERAVGVEQPLAREAELAQATVSAPQRNEDRRAPAGSTVVEQAEPMPHAEVRGQLNLPSGEPAVGAELTLSGWDRDAAHGPLPKWEQLTATTNDEGRFLFRFSPPRGHGVQYLALAARYPDLVQLDWEGLDARAGARIDLQARTFTKAGAVLAQIISKDGTVLVEGWSVYADASGSPGASLAHGKLDPASQAFLIEGLPAGEVSVSASHRFGGRVEPTMFTVGPDLESFAVLHYTGPKLDEQLIVRVALPRWTLGMTGDHAPHLEDAAGEVRYPTRRKGRSKFIFERLEPGPYSLRLDLPPFEPWSQSGVLPGQYIEVRPRSAATVHLKVIDARTRALLSPDELWGELPDEARSRTRFELSEGQRQADGTLVFDDMPPATFSLVARVAGYSEAGVEVPASGAGEQRNVTLQLSKSRTLTGRVMLSDGRTPARGVKVSRTPGAACGWTSAGPTWVGGHKIPPIAASTRTDSEGRFRFEGLSVGEHSLSAELGRWLSVSRTVEWPSGAGDELLLVLPPSGSLEGKLLLPEERSLSELSLLIDLRDHPDRRRLNLFSTMLGGELGEDGSFHIGPLPLGTVSLAYSCGDDLRSPYRIGLQFELGEVTIRAEETAHVEFDERGHFPGRIEVRVYSDGVLLRRGALSVGDETRSTTRALDPSGVTVFADAAPGLWELAYLTPGAAWASRIPYPVQVVAGQTSTVELHVALHGRRVVCVDAGSGEPLRETHIRWRYEPVGMSSSGGGGSLRTDDEGLLSLSLPEGVVRFYGEVSSGWDAPHAEVFWPAGNGELRVELPGGGR